MKKTIEQILLDSLKGKHVTAYGYAGYDNSDVVKFSGFVRGLEIGWTNETAFAIISLDTGKESFEKHEIDLVGEYLEVC